MFLICFCSGGRVPVTGMLAGMNLSKPGINLSKPGMNLSKPGKKTPQSCYNVKQIQSNPIFKVTGLKNRQF